jgi:hypothetical protein
MMYKIIVTFLFIFVLSGPFNSALHAQSNIDSIITSVVSKVEPDSVRHIIQSLQNFQTRFLLVNNRFQIADWLHDRFISLGFTDVERDSFMCTTNYGGTATTLQINIVATLPGTTRPDEIYIIGGHYDSFAYGSQMTNAPGADDNASGTSAVLEFARVIKKSGYQPEATIKFIAFAAEELMLFGDSGCEYYAQKAYDDGMDIKLMINCDMISYNTLPLEQAKVSVNYYSGFTNLLNIAKDATNQFSLITGITGSLNQYSDSYPFYEKGFPAIYFEENQFSPFYHTIDDKIENYDMDYCSEVIKSAGAMLLKYMDMNSPTSIQDEEFIIHNFILEQNYPNPFNPTTTISWQSPINGWQTVRVYDILGNVISTIVDEYKTAGRYVVRFDASQLSSGVYYYQIQSGEFISTKKMILLK